MSGVKLPETNEAPRRLPRGFVFRFAGARACYRLATAMRGVWRFAIASA